MGGGGGRAGRQGRGGEKLYLTPNCHHDTDSCIQMGNRVSQFNVLPTVEERNHYQTVSTNHNS